MNPIEKIIKENILNLNAVFIFPTQTAADLWADKATQVTQVSAVAMERFLAWDDFKSQSVKSRQTDRTSIPSTMRQIFCAQILAQNAKDAFFKSIIPPEYAKNAANFVNWISGVLPSLSIWKTYFDYSDKNPDDEDLDLLKLYELYKNFLDSHKLFDPAWEKPPFKKDGNHYYIFYPEILSDYTEYKSLLENSAEDITLIHLPQQNDSQQAVKGTEAQSIDLSPLPKVQFYNDSRSELKSIALQLRSIHKEENIPWDEIAVSVPDLDSYGVYLDRELELYEIPHVIRASKSLASTGSGTFFLQLQNCVASDFNFASLKTLLFNTELPWKNPELSKELIAFGQTNNCICNFVYKNQKNDIWLKSFADDYKVNPELQPYYLTIKKLTENIVKAQSFEKIRAAYFAFRAKFFDMEKCSPKTDRLISRCISELGGLIDLENNFPDCTVENPYKFFVDKLNNTQYLEQTDNRGVQILPYKMSAVAPFGCHVILDSSQSSLSVIYKQLSFLREDKRRMLLKADDPNISEYFIRLYSMNSYKHPAIFTCAAKNFTGYSQPTSYLEEESFTASQPDFFEDDLYLAERKSLLQSRQPLSKITRIEKDGFDFWTKAQVRSEAATLPAEELVNEKMIENRCSEDYLKVSTTHLKKFFECERSWLLYYIINLNELDNEASVMNQFAQGTLKHKILELFLNALKDSNQVLIIENEELPQAHVQILRDCIESAIKDKEYGRNRKSYLARELLNTTAEALFEEMLKTITDIAFRFEGYSVYGTEQRFEYLIEEKKLLCQGTVDCLLQNPEDAGFVLIDFKSSKGAIPAILSQADLDKHPEIEYPDFQMPMYLYLLQNQEKKFPVDKCLFYNIKDSQPKEIDLDSFAPVMDKFMKALDLYADHIRNQKFFENPKKDFSECNGCTYRAICRKIFTVGKAL